MTYRLQATSQFKRDCKPMKRRGLDLANLTAVIELPRNGEELPSELRDHALVGDFSGFRECHIQPDWLLFWTQDDDELILVMTRTGTHAEVLR